MLGPDHPSFVKLEAAGDPHWSPRRLEAALVNIESPYTATADGLTLVIAWGLPYFRTWVSTRWQAKAPRDLGYSKATNQDQLAVQSPHPVKLEDNQDQGVKYSVGEQI